MSTHVTHIIRSRTEATVFCGPWWLDVDVVFDLYEYLNRRKEPAASWCSECVAKITTLDRLANTEL